MKAQFDNPAARLHNILTNVNGVAATERMLPIWGRAMGMSDQNPNAILSALGRVHALPEEISHSMQLIPGYHVRDVTRWWDPLTDVFIALHPDAQWGNVSNLIRGDLLDDIDSVAAKLSVYIHDPHLNDEQLDYVSKQIQYIRLQLASADELTIEVRRNIEFRLKRIEEALRLVPITGTSQVQVEIEALSANAAAESLRPDQAPEQKKALGGLARAGQRILLFLQIYQAVQTIALPADPTQQLVYAPNAQVELKIEDEDITRWILEIDEPAEDIQETSEANEDE